MIEYKIPLSARIIFGAIFFIGVVFSGKGQNRNLVGRIVSSDSQQPIRDANVVILGTTRGTITNHLGFFSLELKSDDPKTLIVSHIGYLTSQIELPEADNFKILLDKEYLEIAELNISYFTPLDLPAVESKSISSNENQSDEDFYQVEVNAEYPGGWDYFFNDLGNRLLRDSILVGKIDSGLDIKFKVNHDGYIDEVKIDTDSKQFADYLTEVLTSLNRWTPARQRKMSVPQFFLLPLKWSTAEEIFTVVENPARPTGGMNAFYQSVGNIIKYPAEARRKGIEGRVFVEFVVDKDGTITEPRIVKGIGGGCDEEAIRAIMSSGKWYPGTQRGKPVKQRMVMPITFSLGKRINMNPVGLPITTIAPTIDYTIKDFYEFFSKNIRYPPLARRTGVDGYVLLEFTIDTLKLSSANVRLIEDIGAGCGDEVLRIFQEMPWNVLKTVMTDKKKYILPIGFGLGKRVVRKTDYSIDGDTELLREVLVTAMGIERERKSTGGFSPVESSSYPGIPLIDANLHRSFETAFLSRKKVEALSLVNKGITEIPIKIGELTHLRFIDLESNSIRNIPNEIASLSKLEELYLRNNNLETLPDNFGTLPSLRILGLANNRLNEFPVQITHLPSLEALDLSANGLESIPQEIVKLTKLKQLFLKDNLLENLPEEIFAMKKLNKLHLEGNPLNIETKSRLKRELSKTEIYFGER